MTESQKLEKCLQLFNMSTTKQDLVKMDMNGDIDLNLMMDMRWVK